MRDIRQKGRYELHEALTNQAATIQLSKLAIESEREISAKALADAAANQLALEKVQAMADAAAAELERFRTKKYEEIPKYDHVYINKEVAELHSDRHKLGKAIDEKRRESQLNTGSAQGRRNIDTLASSFEFITRGEMIDRLQSKLEDERDACYALPMPPTPVDVDDATSQSTPVPKRKVGRPKQPQVLPNLRDINPVNTPSPPLKAVNMSKLCEFLQMVDDERGCRISRVNGSITWVDDFKAAFNSKMACRFEPDPATFHQFGYRLSAKEEHVCKACKKLAKSGCCTMYKNSDRGKKKVIYDMVMTCMSFDGV